MGNRSGSGAPGPVRPGSVHARTTPAFPASTRNSGSAFDRHTDAPAVRFHSAMGAHAAGGGTAFGRSEAVPDLGIEVPSSGFGLQQFRKNPAGNLEVRINSSVAEFQFQHPRWVLVVGRGQPRGM